jgi:prepilin-type N-terminal cleavage/methylation domain-containing protein
MKLQKIEPRQIFTPQSQCGFTLIELLIAMVILSIGMLGTASLTTGIIRGNFFSKNITSATAIAQTTLEGAQRVGYSGVDAYVANTTSVPPNPSMGGVTFTQSASVTTASNLKTVSVTVNWSEMNNASRSVNLQTILAQ